MICLISFLLSIHLVNGQQVPRYSLYVFERYIYNPAYAGQSDALEFSFLSQRQYTGFAGSPFINSLAIHSPIQSTNFSVGVKVYNDYFKPVNFSGFMGTIAYRLKQPTFSLSFAIEPGANLRVVDYNGLIKDSETDPALDTKSQSIGQGIIPDLNVGVFFQHKSGFYAGFSTIHLIPFTYGNNLSYKRDPMNSLTQNHFLMAGYKYNLAKIIDIEPSALIKFNQSFGWQADLSLYASFQNIVGGGVIYRPANSVAPYVKFTLLKALQLAYCYDFSITSISRYTGATHEIMLRYKFPLKRYLKIRIDPRYY